jgi:hypothetical protein
LGEKFVDAKKLDGVHKEKKKLPKQKLKPRLKRERK